MQQKTKEARAREKEGEGVACAQQVLTGNMDESQQQAWYETRTAGNGQTELSHCSQRCRTRDLAKNLTTAHFELLLS